MRVLLVDTYSERAGALDRKLQYSGHEVIARITNSLDLIERVARLRPDIIIIELESPDRDTLESMRILSRDNPRPVVMFAEKSDPKTIKHALRAGVSAYVVDCVDSKRLRGIMQVATTRFQQYQELKSELEDVKTKLADRRDTDRAKGLLMKQGGMTEEEAYRTLRKLAMDRNNTIGEAARNLIAVANLLHK